MVDDLREKIQQLQQTNKDLEAEILETRKELSQFIGDKEQLELRMVYIIIECIYTCFSIEKGFCIYMFFHRERFLYDSHSLQLKTSIILTCHVVV